MEEISSPDWTGLRQARDKLAAQIGDRPEISLIDIGVDPQSESSPRAMVLRVHVHRQWKPKKTPIPDQIDGIRVIVMTGDYQVE
jgi:hypothetical protein